MALMFWLGLTCGAQSPVTRAPCLMGVQPITEPLHYAFGEAPVALLLSRSSYPAEDRHIDAIVQINGEGVGRPAHSLQVTLCDTTGKQLAREDIRPIPGPQIFLSMRFPAKLAGKGGSLSVSWTSAGKVKGMATANFRVRPAATVPRSGRVRLRIPNDTKATLRGIPCTVGVPFPRGALWDAAHVRLADGSGQAVPLQARVTGKWSRFGSIRWLQCDFACDVVGNPVTLWLVYGTDPRTSGNDIAPTAQLEQPPSGPAAVGPFLRHLTPEAQRGAFIEGEGGKRFSMTPEGDGLSIDEDGPCKRLLSSQGWYESTDGETFCRFVTRYVVFRDSPVLRIFHTWIFTGDGNSERIRDMGWRFPLVNAGEPRGFLTGSGANARWAKGQHLVQYDHSEFEITGDAGATVGERAPGAVASRTGDATVLVGIKHFWQNYPRELEFDGDTMVFHEWPRHGKPQGHAIDNTNKLRLWFCHEGELLDFRLPDVYTQAPIVTGLRHETYWRKNTPEDINAQGISKTSEIWVVSLDAEVSPQAASRAHEGLNRGTLQAVVDPAWLAATGAFGAIHHRDLAKYPEDERVYELHALAPMIWAERSQIYGKWVWGNMLWTPNIFTGGGGLYRAFRKAHQGWPYTWIPYARSGDARFLAFAEAATRTMTDVCYSHYSDAKTDNRMRGQWYRGGMPWVGSNRGRPGRPFVPVLRGYSNEVEYLWRCYHLTGYKRALDVIQDWAHLVKKETLSTGHLVLQPGTSTGRKNTNMLKTYVDMYQETFDPWFLAAAHQVARGPDRTHLRHFWKPGPRDFQRFSGDPDFTRWYIDKYARSFSTQQDVFTTGAWAAVCPQIESAAHAYLLTKEIPFLRRVVGWLDYTRAATYDGAPAFMHGFLVRDYNPGCGPSYTAYYLRQFPEALFALERAGHRPPALPSAFHQLPATVSKIPGTKEYDWQMPTVALLKAAARELRVTVRLNRCKYAKQPFGYALSGPDGDTVSQGTVQPGEPVEIRVPPEIPAGTYRLRVSNRLSFTPTSSSKITFERQLPGLWLPVSPPDTPEVLEIPAGDTVGRGYWKSQYWFRTSAELDTLTIYFPLPSGRAAKSWARLNRISVLDASGRVVWRHQYCGVDDDGPKHVTAALEVPPEQRGKLWQVTLPGRSLGFTLDPRLPSVLATSADRWFHPDAMQ